MISNNANRQGLTLFDNGISTAFTTALMLPVIVSASGCGSLVWYLLTHALIPFGLREILLKSRRWMPPKKEIKVQRA
jgi:hypothetical protein